jgi:hypothetical protein
MARESNAIMMKSPVLVSIVCLLTVSVWAQDQAAESTLSEKPSVTADKQTIDAVEEQPSEDDGLFQVGGYPEEERIVGTPTDVDRDLNTAFPKRNSVFGDKISLSRKGYFQWKEDLYEKTGLKLAFAYNAGYFHTSDVTTTFPLPSPDDDSWAAAGWLQIETKWTILNRGEDWQGAIVAGIDWRHEYGDIEPAFFQFQTGSLWANEFLHVSWDPWFFPLYWEQWGKKDRFVFRVGSQVATQTLDFFRFKDGRTSFSNAQATVPSGTMPWPGPGFGAMFEWWPIEDSNLYVLGTINDMNAEPGEWSWDNAFEYGQFFYAIEVGNHLGTFPRNFDHVHLTLYYADKRDTQAGGDTFFPNKAGWGFKVAGEKQWGKIVGFANYSYNTAEGGHFGITLGRHGVNAGVARLMPFGIRGEAAVGATWMNPIQEFEGGVTGWSNARDQFGIEAYWKILLTPDLWITPGGQFIWNPSYNLDRDFIAVGSFKFRLFF